jgi:hypothetical protein
MYEHLPWEETEVGGDNLGAKRVDKEGMWMDVAAQGASKEKGAHGDAGMQRRSERALAMENASCVGLCKEARSTTPTRLCL